MNTHKYLKYSAVPLKTLCILLVVMFLLGVIQIIITEIYWAFSREQISLEETIVSLPKQEQQQWDIHNAQKHFAEDGTLYLVKTESMPGTRENRFIVKDQHGNVLFEGEEKDNPYKFIQWYPKTKERYGHYQNIDQRYLNQLNLIGGEFSRHFVIPMVDDNNHRIGHWFFDVDKQIFKYYSIDGQSGGYLGTNGFTANKSDAVGFENCLRMINWLRFNTYDPLMIYQTKYAVYQLDFANREVKALTKTDNDPIRCIILTNWQETEEYDYRPFLAVYTESNKCCLHLKNPEQAIEIQPPPDTHTYSMFQFAADKDTIFARLEDYPQAPKTNDWNDFSTWYRENRNNPKEKRILLFEVDRAGKLFEKSSFVWTEPVLPPSLTRYSTGETIPSIVNSLSSPVPKWIIHQQLKTRSYHQGPVWIQPVMEFIQWYSRFKISINLCVMSVFALLTLLHGWPRRTNILKLIFWVIFVFLFNLPGLLTYLALNHFAVIPCVNCGKKRGLLRNTCCRCEAPLPLPKTKETDLVMPLSA